MLYIYNASAGSGKTYQLVLTYITQLLQNGIHTKNAHSSILAITFTNKATAEMKSRILKELHLLATNVTTSPYNKTLTTILNIQQNDLQLLAKHCLFDILQDYTHFAIMTVDSFFQQVVRNFAREMQLSPNFDICLDEERIIEEATDQFFFNLNRQKNEDITFHWVNDLMLNRVYEGHSWDPRELIAKVSKDLLSEKIQTALQQNYTLFSNKEQLKIFKNTLLTLWQNKKKLPRKKTDEEKEQDKKGNTAMFILKKINELGVITDIAEELKTENQKQYRVPISQINSILHTIIDNSETPFIYEKIGTRFSHFLLDEFQDTSELQWRNLYPLVKEANDKGNTNLIVGDIKQSIYRWRNSNWHLLQQVQNTILPNKIKMLEINYRSSKVIVDFNNNFFPAYCQTLITKDKLSDLNNLPATLQTVYQSIAQTPFRTDNNGGVTLYAIEQEISKEEKDNKALSFVLTALENTSKRNIPLNNVAILVRKRKDVIHICSFLLQHGYNVDATEGLLLKTHASIQFLIAIFKLQIDENNEIDLQQISNIRPEGLNNDDKTFLQKAFAGNLYDATQNIINHFALNELPNAPIYIATFQNIIYRFINNNGSNIYEFLHYWEQQNEKLFIPNSFSQNSIRVMTIHKAKGLEFDTVILPYTNWSTDKEKGNNDNLWCCSPVTPFNQLFIYPLSISEELKKTYFAENYNKEIIELCIDSTNLLYVALTRAKEQLYICCQPPEEHGKIQNVEHIIYLLFKDKFETNNNCYTIGSQNTPYNKIQNNTNINTTIKTFSYHNVPIGNRLFLLPHNDENINDSLSTLDMGNIMHQWLALIKTKNDTDNAWNYLLNNGIARKNDKDKLEPLMQQFWHLVHPYDWFEPTWIIKCEEPIITPAGKIFRPDRLLLNNKEKKAIVIDYKLGTKQMNAHTEQILNYKTILQTKGYNTKAYLIYITLNKIIPLND